MTQVSHQRALNRYYRWHSRIYDMTRWSFLFGRRWAIEAVADGPPSRVLEVGCGTGTNIRRLCDRSGNLRLLGIDPSEDMLDVARRKLADVSGRVELRRLRLEELSIPEGRRFDSVLCSYALSMFHPNRETAIEHLHQLLPPGGTVVVVDFHRAGKRFSDWMRWNHVMMDGRVLPQLRDTFRTVTETVHEAYSGLWSYFAFVGKKRGRRRAGPQESDQGRLRTTSGLSGPCSSCQSTMSITR